MDLTPVEFTIAGEWGKWEDKRDALFDRLRFHASLKIPHLVELDPHEGVCHIVGSAPTAINHTEELRTARGEKDLLCSLNGAHGLLIRNGIIPNIHVIFEIDIPDLKILGSAPHRDVYYYVCSHCPGVVVDGLVGHKMVLWHCFNDPPDYQDLIKELYPDEFMIGGGHATLFRTINIARVLGYRRFELYGCDGSFEQEQCHFDDYPTPPQEEFVTIWGHDLVTGENKPFRTIGSLAFQANEFINFCIANEDGVSIKVHGNGLLRYVHESRFPRNYKEAA